MTEQEVKLCRYIEARKKKEIVLIPVLQKARELYGEINPSVQQLIAKQLDIPLSDVSGVVTFYSEFNGMDDGKADNRIINTSIRSENGYICSSGSDYQSLKKTVYEQLDIVSMLKAARICGRSGSGFPVGNKWAMTRDAKADEKYIICNGSEGEGDTYKDFMLMCQFPNTIIEGMIICAIVTGIRKGYIYIRSEYYQAQEKMQAAVKEAYKKGILGRDILGIGKVFDLEVIRGGGAYVCGEETALLQSLAGRRGEPRLKPPYPGISGYNGKPTIINNAESFAAVPALVMHGVEKFRELGTETAGGTKLFTVTGCVEHPGVYELPHKCTLRQVLEQAAGGVRKDEVVKGVQLGGGATGTIAAVDKLDTILDYKMCAAGKMTLGTGSIRFISEKESIVKLCGKCISFLAEQSCGMCTPCRYGTIRMKELLSVLGNGTGNKEDLEELKELSVFIQQSSRCGLGQAAPGVFISAYHAFREEFEQGGLRKNEEVTDCYE